MFREYPYFTEEAFLPKTYAISKSKLLIKPIDCVKAFDCMDHNKLWKILKEMRVPDHPTYLLRNLYVGQEETVRTLHETTDWFQIGKGVHQSYILPLLI